MKAINTLKDLIEHLRVHPDLMLISDIPHLNGPRKFLRYERGMLWWADHCATEGFFPVHCGMAESETGIEFSGHEVVFRKFGTTTRLQLSNIEMET